MIKRNFWKAHLALFVVNALYGAGHIIAKGVMPKYLSPTTFIAFRIAGAMIMFWIIKLFLPKERIDKKDIPRFILCSMFGITINQLFFFHGLSLSSSINSGIIMTTNPLLVVIAGYFLVQEKIGLTKLFGIGIGASGAILLTVTGKTTAGESSLGDIYLFLNAISYAIYLVLAKPLMKKYSPFTTITYFFTFGFVLVLLYPPTIIETMNVSLTAIPIEIWAKIVYVLVGDGECYEGSIWEAAISATELELGNLTVIVDCNGHQNDGVIGKKMNYKNLKDKWEGFGWNTILCDGHNMAELLNVLKTKKKNIPTAIIAKTTKGKGVNFMENNNDWHHGRLSKSLFEEAIKLL
jgi:drug/metabolite transporter (DMT)-like permease